MLRLRSVLNRAAGADCRVACGLCAPGTARHYRPAQKPGREFLEMRDTWT